MIGAADADESDDAEDADADIEAAIVTPSTGSSTHVEPSSLIWSFFRAFNHNRHHWGSSPIKHGVTCDLPNLPNSKIFGSEET